MKFSCIPSNPSREKRGMVWVKSRCFNKTWWTIPNANKNLSELRLEAEEMVSTIIVFTKQHLINIVYSLTYLTWIVKWRNPSQHDDGRIQVQQVARRTIFGMILNCAFVSSLQLQHTWRPDRFNPQDSATKKNV
jgi:hypothetical protein